MRKIHNITIRNNVFDVVYTWKPDCTLGNIIIPEGTYTGLQLYNIVYDYLSEQFRGDPKNYEVYWKGEFFM